jgi:hypothetical protein
MFTIVEKSIPLGYDTVTGQVVPEISKDCSSFIYRVQRPKKVGMKQQQHHISQEQIPQSHSCEERSTKILVIFAKNESDVTEGSVRYFMNKFLYTK